MLIYVLVPVLYLSMIVLGTKVMRGNGKCIIERNSKILVKLVEVRLSEKVYI